MPSAQGIRSGKAFIELTLKDTGLAKGLAAAEAKLKGIGDSLVGIGKKIGAVGLAGAAAFVPMVKAAAEANDQFGKFESVFGPLTDEVAKFAKELSDAMGRSEQSIIKFLATAQGMFVTFGFDQQAAANISKTLAELTIDMAEFHDVSEEEVFEGLTKAMLGSARALKQYGVNLSEAAVDQQLLNEGLKPDLASEQQKVLARLAIVMRATAKEQGEAVRSAKEFDSQFSRTKGIIQDTAVAIGRALLPSLGQIFSAMNKNLAVARDWIKENENLVRLVASATVGIVSLSAATISLGVAFFGVSKALAALRGALGFGLKGLQILLTVIPALLSPIGLLTAAVAGLAVVISKDLGTSSRVFTFLKEQFGELGREVSLTVEAMGQALAEGDISAAAKVLWATLKFEWTKGIAFLNTEWLAWKTFFLRVWTEAVFNLAEIFLKGTAQLQDVWNNTTTVLSVGWSGMVGQFGRAWSKVAEEVKAETVKIKGLFDKSLDVKANVKKVREEFEKQRGESLDEQNKAIFDALVGNLAEKEKIADDRVKALEALESDRQTNLGTIGDQESKSLGKIQGELDQARRDWKKAVDAEAIERKKLANNLGADNALEDFKKQLAAADEGLEVAQKTAPSTPAQFGGQRAEQIFGVSDNVAKQQLAVQREQLVEQKKTRKAVEDAGLAFS